MAGIDFDKFRLRPFVERLVAAGECAVVEEAVPLARVSELIEASRPAKLFRNVGPECQELAAAVCGSRKRLAIAFGVDERDIAQEYLRRLDRPQRALEVGSAQAPVHQVVQRGEEVDLTRLPFHLQHELDGGPYISSAVDFCVDPVTGRNNVGMRRLMLRDRRSMRSHLYSPSHIKDIYRACVQRGEKLPATFVIGCHPLMLLAATLRQAVDEYALAATVRGEPAPMVRGVTNGILAPADAEFTIEGYFDELGYREKEGPFGEFNGFYSGVLLDPVFHVTAITHRDDALFQTAYHGGRYLSWTDGGQLASVNAEVQVWRTLRAANIEPAAVNPVPAASSGPHMRIALRRGSPGEARRAIAALFSMTRVKHVFVVDDDIDVYSDEDMEWAMYTRFRGDRDLVLEGGFPGYYNEPTLAGYDSIAKVGFDLTAPYGVPDTLEARRPRVPKFAQSAAATRCETLRDALQTSPLFFKEIMQAMGSSDGREIALGLEELRSEGQIDRDSEGRYFLV